MNRRPQIEEGCAIGHFGGLLDGEEPPQRESDLRDRAGHEFAQGLLRHVRVLVVAEDLRDIGETLREASHVVSEDRGHGVGGVAGALGRDASLMPHGAGCGELQVRDAPVESPVRLGYERRQDLVGGLTGARGERGAAYSFDE
jgi:hypothetical protein